PSVSLSSSVVDFGCVEDGASAAQTVKLVNSSPVEVVYQWDVDCGGNSVFSIRPASGTLLPHSHATLKALYRPTQPIAHHRRVACLILHREPVFLDLIGTCHSEHQKPAILKPEHLVLYKLHSPDALTAMQQDQNGHLDQQGVHSSTLNQRPDSAAVMSTMDPSSLPSSSSSQHVSVVPSELLFNHKTTSWLSTSCASSQSVSITNNTRGKLGLVWTVSRDSPFSVSPSLCDLAPLKSTSFRVTYEPKQLNSLHGAELECFAYSKDGHDAGEPPVSPPWCVTVRVIGHSFQPGKEHFLPCCTLKPPQVVFPAQSVVSHRTVLFQNDGDLPLTFCLDHSSIPAGTEFLFVEPSCGLIQPRDYQILTLRTAPSEESPKQGFNLRLQLNAAKLTREITVVSVVEKPCMSLEGGSSLYFQPTAVGSQTRRTHHIRNLSRVPIRFQWSIPEPDQELICVEPDGGELHPNESSVQTWCFSPPAEETYTLSPTLVFWPIQTDGSDESHLTLKVVGMGSQGSIEAEEAVLDVGEILVGSYRSFEVPLVNNSPCPVSFCLTVQQMLLDDGLAHDPQTVHSALQLDSERGTIPSHSTVQLRSIVRPHSQAQYLWNISYQTVDARGFVSSSPQTLCQVRAQGVFPTLQVMDACGGGSVARLSKMHLWKLFSLDSLNEHLLSSPSPAELMFRTPTRHSFRSSPSIFTKAMLDFNFSSATMNSNPSRFVLMFYNPGSIPVNWAFLFPEDQQIELEHWAVSGEFSSTELHQMKVQDNQLFSISPRSGTLLPGHRRAVHFSYSHDFSGTHRLPVVFKLSHGREILLNFHGVTVDRDAPFLHFASNTCVFTSVPTGDCSPPRQQVCELHNGGAVPVRYEVDTAALSQLQVDNFNHPLLCCLNPEGRVLPGKTTKLEWIFSPLEAKMYQMDVPIHIQGRDVTLVRFEGCGLDSRSNPLTSSDSKACAPCVQRVPFPGQVLFLSEDTVSLGHIPVCSQSSRTVFLTNVSYTDSVHYMWELPQQGDQQVQDSVQVVQIHPERGGLRPGECVLCALTFTSSDYPTVYQLDLVCQVSQEAELVGYRDALQRWEEERQRDEFTTTDQNVTESRRMLIDQEPPAAPASKGPPLRKYKTLPPICASSTYETVASICTKRTRAERRLQRETPTVWRRPDPPQPTLLHLAVTAHSHGRLEYCTHLPDQFNQRYRFLQSEKNQQPEKISVPAGPSTLTHGPDKDILVLTLTSLLRNILDDSAFVRSLIPLASKPHTYQPTETTSSHCASFPSSPRPPVCSTSSSPRASPQPPVLLSGDRQRTAGGSGAEAQRSPQAERVPADMTEDVLLSTLQNLMMEAVRGELVLTAHPHTVISPPASPRSRRTSEAVAEEHSV
ncbi:coiled-coil domain-containing protein 108, partial [Stegastes partitus]|uniref:Coiled-coil domain-containing protein 108 n=1 Tax=Stegastes partitus TaxID=144197 RepID=A0A9Y4NC01_9TELE